MRCCSWKARFRWFSLLRIESSWLVIRTDSGRWRWDSLSLRMDRISYVFASETCAFDLIGAAYMSDVEPGEMVIVGPEGLTRERYAPRKALRNACSSTSTFRARIHWFSAVRLRNRAN